MYREYEIKVRFSSVWNPGPGKSTRSVGGIDVITAPALHSLQKIIMLTARNNVS